MEGAKAEVLDMNKEKGDAVVSKVGESNALFVECRLTSISDSINAMQLQQQWK